MSSASQIGRYQIIDQVIQRTILLAFSILPISSFAGSSCGDFPPPGFDGPDQSHFTGIYWNENYNYKVTIPPNLVGINAPPPSPQHGFGIVLSSSPTAYLYVDGSFNAADDGTLSGLANETLKFIKEDVTRILSVRRFNTRAGSLRSIRQIVRYRCSNTTGDFISDETLTLNRSKTIYYTIRLITSKSRYRADSTILNEILHRLIITDGN